MLPRSEEMSLAPENYPVNSKGLEDFLESHYTGWNPKVIQVSAFALTFLLAGWDPLRAVEWFVD